MAAHLALYYEVIPRNNVSTMLKALLSASIMNRKACSVLQGEIGFFLNIVRKEHSEILLIKKARQKYGHGHTHLY